jgi:hypothetical protein
LYRKRLPFMPEAAPEVAAAKLEGVLSENSRIDKEWLKARPF